MPTEIAQSSAPSARRAESPGTNSRDSAPLSITALTIIAVLVVVLHIAGRDLLGRPQSHLPAGVPGGDVNSEATATPQASSLPFD